MRHSLLLGLGIAAALLTSGAADAAGMGLKCKNGSVNVSVSGGDCGNTNGTITCSNGDSNKASGSCDSNGNPTCGSGVGSGVCSVTRHATTFPGQPTSSSGHFGSSPPATGVSANPWAR